MKIDINQFELIQVSTVWWSNLKKKKINNWWGEAASQELLQFFTSLHRTLYPFLVTFNVVDYLPRQFSSCYHLHCCRYKSYLTSLSFFPLYIEINKTNWEKTKQVVIIVEKTGSALKYFLCEKTFLFKDPFITKWHICHIRTCKWVL